jgi:hypothetical protein
MASGTSYNGWPASDDKGAIHVEPFGDAVGFPFPGGVRADDVTAVLGYVATQLHNRVEPCVSGWCWGYSYKQNVNNPSQLSCHASGTAIDWNAPDHPNGSSGTFTAAQVGTIYAILDEVQGAVDWLSGYDEMHFEICVDAATLADVARQLPAGGGGPTPSPEPTPAEDDDMLQLVKDVNDPSGATYASGPGVFRHVKDGETLDSGHSAGLWDKTKVREMNARERDVVAAFTNAPNLGE